MKKSRVVSRIVVAIAVVVTTCLSAFQSRSTPYASGVTNSAGTIKFMLNENADQVYVLFNNNTVSNNLVGQTNKGPQSFSLGAYTNFSIGVFKIGAGQPTQISVDASNTVKFTSAAARGVAVNSNPKDWRFGLIYTLNSTAGGTGLAAKGRGIYIFNADTSDAFGRGATASGAVFNSGSASSPYRIGLGPDNTVYVSDFSTVAATVWKFDPEVANPAQWTNVLAIIGQTAGIAAGIHGDISSAPCVSGSLAGGNLTLYTADAALGPVYNSINRYSIGAGPLPYSNAPVQLGNIGLGGIAELNTDLALGPDGKLYGTINRANTAYDVPSVTVFDTDGVTPLWNSITGPGGSLFVGPDIFLDTRSISVSPDGQWLAALHTDNHVSVVRLTNGIPDATSLFTIANTPSTGNGRQIGWDLAQNIYTMSSGQALLRVISLGGTSTAFTRNDVTGTNGTFLLTTPATKVSVTATTPQASQSGPTPGVFTITRSSTVSDETNAPLIVSFTLTSTASNGTYNFLGGSVVSTLTNITFFTNTTTLFATYPNTTNITTITSNITYTASVTMAAGVNETNIYIVPDTANVSRPTIPVTLALKGGGNYTPKQPVSAVVNIANTGPQYLFISGVDAPTMYKGYSNDYASFVITRWGDTSVASYSVSSYTYGGTAALNTDYYGAGSITIDPGVVSVTNTVLRTEVPPSGIYVGNKSVIVGLGTGVGYTAGPNTATLTVIDNAKQLTNVFYSNGLTNSADASNWAITYGTGDPTNNSANYNVDFGYDLTTDPGGNHGIIGLPPNGATTALRITCNKLNNPGAAGGVNVYLTNQLFSGNYAVQFDMNIIQGGNLTFSTEGALFGINHTGSQSNWWYGSGPFPAGATWSSDGIWYWTSADPGGASPGDFLEFTGAGGTNGNIGWQQPGAKSYTNFTKAYKIPTLFTAQEGTPQRSGVPANGSQLNGLATTNWSNVEIRQYKNGATSYVTTMSINNYSVFAYTNNTVWTNGFLMLGYSDPYGGTTGQSIGNPDAAVYFSNLRVASVPAPLITLQPTNLIVGVTSNATFVLNATFDPAATVTNGQWYFGSTPIPGATNQTYSIASVNKTNYGSYFWTITDGPYTVSSAVVTLRPPMFSILTNPVAGFIVAAGIPTNLVSAANSYSGTTNYQWQLNSVNIPGATNRIYSFTSGPTNYGTFRVVINDAWNSATSTVAVVTPPAPNIVSVLPVTRAAVLGSSPTYTVTANSFSGLTNYQWFSNSVSIAGATGSVLTLTNVQAGNFGSLYTVRVNDGTTSITSSPPVTLTLAVSQQITSPALNGNKFRLSFNTEFGPNYVVDSKTNLLQTNWIPTSTNAGTGGILNVTNTTSSGTEGYYRIRLQ